MKTLNNLFEYLKNKNIMSKRLALILALMVAPLATFGQEGGLFDKYEENEEVTSIVFTQKVFRMLTELKLELDDPEAKEILDMAGKITGLKVLTTGDKAVSDNMKSDLNRYLRSADLEELMRIKDGDQTVKFYVKEGKDDNHVKELLMFATGINEAMGDKDITINGEKREFETVVLSLTGDIDLRQISKLANQMDVPGGKQLEKVKDKN